MAAERRRSSVPGGLLVWVALVVAGLGVFWAYITGSISLSAGLTEPIATSSGKVQGHIARGTSGVSEFVGIPYAKPPIGDLRWAPPEHLNASARESSISATKYGHSCPTRMDGVPFRSTDEVKLTSHADQVMTALLRQPGVTYDEDCLTLNIWTKSHSEGGKKAVLFWIYGGGYNTGTTNNAGYNGKYLADHEDVVVVTINYRLNIFGFPGNPESRNNLGLLDQRLALEWVRDNIAAFGGDPERITLFGESAGGSSVDYYTYAWAEDPIAAGFIAQSGNVFSPNSQTDKTTAATTWYNVTETLSCGNVESDQDELLRCMRSKDWETVQAAIPQKSGLAGVVGSFGPTIDDIVVFSDYPERSVAGNVIKRPLFIGNTDNEAGLFKPTFASQNITYPKMQWDLMAQQLFTCSSSNRALAAVINQVPIWRYRWFGDLACLKITTEPDSGAYHGSEVAVIFGTDQDIQIQVSRTDAEHDLVAYIRGAWAAFAKDPVNGLTEYGFPKYDPSEATLVRLAFNNETGPHLALPNDYETGCFVSSVLAEFVEAMTAE